MPGISVLANRESPPEGAGSDYYRLLLIAGNARTERALLTQVSSQLAAAGWADAPCVTAKERCFTSAGYFAALAAAHSAPMGYLAPIAKEPQVAVVLEPALPGGS